MRLHEIAGTARVEWHQHLSEVGLSDTAADAASRQADGMMKRAKLAKMRAAVVKAQKALSAKQQALSTANRNV